MRLKEPAVLYKALDMGINLFDTANNYQNGNNEKMLGTVMKEYGRQKAFIITKVHPFHMQQTLDQKFQLLDSKAMHEMMEQSLKRLQTDYVDVLLIHNIMEAGWPLDEKIMAFCQKVKKSGKARFVGLSLHDPRCYVEVADIVAKSDIYDVLLAWLNFKSTPEHIEALQRARKANKGIIAMKTQAGGYTKGATAAVSPQQAALKWALQQDFVDSTIPGMVNLEQLAENLGALGKKVGWIDRKILHSYYSSIRDRYCIMCGKCASTCSSCVDIHTINRALMYCEGYGDFAQARRTYRQLSDNENALACMNCTAPTCSCVNGIQLPERARQAHALFV
jgi:aryl-alcohol dehydrogenase-like predicted oxidoreductase